MPPDLKRLPPAAARRLREYYRRKRVYALLRVLLSAGSVYLLLALLVMHLDRFLFLETSTRVLMTTVVHAAGILHALLLTGLFVTRRVTTRRLAYELESRLPPDVSERYVTLATLDTADTGGSRSDVSRSLVDQLVRETISYSESFLGGRLVFDRRFRILGGVTAALLGLYALLLVPDRYQFDLMMQRFAMPRANLPKPGFVTLEVTPASAVIGRGGEIVIQARTEGTIPRALSWLYRLAGTMPGDCLLTVIPADTTQPASTVAMSRIQRELYIHSATELLHDFSFRVRSADAETALHVIEVVTQPVITQTTLTLTPPDYTRLPVVTLTDVQDAVSIYPGTRVELSFRVDQLVTDLEVTLPRDRTQRPGWDPDTRTGTHAFAFAEPFDMEISVVNARGFANTVPVRIAFRAREDQRPTVSLEYPGGDLTAVPGELIPIQFRVEDDLGIEDVFVQYVLNPDDDTDHRPPQELIVEFDKEGDPLARDLSYMFDLEGTGAVPGDQVLFLIRARDSGGNDGESRPITVMLTAFARGENERRRLAVLAFLEYAIQRLGDVADAGSLADTIREEAARRDIPIEPGPIHASLLRLMEQEHHFTDHPLHKADMQHLAGLVRAANRADGEVADGGALYQAAARHIPDLIASRRLQNAIWGYFGLVYELTSILERMAQSETERVQHAETVNALLIAHAEALVQAAREDAALGERVASLNEHKAALAAAQAAMQREREALEAELMPGMGGLGQQLDSPEFRRLSAVLADQRPLVTAAEGDAYGRGIALGQSILSQGDRQIIEASVATSAVRTIQGRIAVQAATDRAQPMDAFVRQTVSSQMSGVRTGAGDMQSINRRAGLFLRSAENTGAALTGLPWDERFDTENLRKLQGNLNFAINRVARTGADIPQRLAAGRDIHGRILELVSLTAAQVPALGARETLAREALAHDVHALRGGLTGDALAAWIQADLMIQELNPFADLVPYVRGLAQMDSQTPDGSQLIQALDEQAPAPPSVVAGYGYLLALDHAFQSLVDNPRVSPAERDLAFRVMALESALYFGTLNPTNEASAWHTAVAAFDPANPAPGPASLASLLEGIAIGDADGPSPAMRELLARHVLPDPHGALRASLRDWRVQDAVFEATQADIRALDEGLSQTLSRLMKLLRADVAALDLYALRLHLRLAWMPPGPRLPAEHALLLRLREGLGRYHARSAGLIATLDGFTRRPISAADASEASAAVRGLAGTVQVLRTALEGLLDGSGTVDASRYPLLATFEETALLRELAFECLSGDDPEGIARRYLDGFSQAAGYLIAMQRPRLVVALEHVRRALGQLDTDTVDPVAIDAILDAAVAELDAFGLAVKAVENEEAARLRADAGEHRNRIAAQRFAGAAPEEGTVRQRLFVLTETAGQLPRLVTRIADGPDPAATPAAVYSGGPENIWTRGNRMHAETARTRLNAQSAHADRRMASGLLAGLPPEEGAPRARQAAANWSDFLYRLARSPLTGPVRTVTVTQAEGAGIDPLTEWLMRQLDEARREAVREGTMKEYRGQTLEWIDSLRDYLRY